LNGSRTVAIVNKAENLMAKEAYYVIYFNLKALYILPLATSYLFSLEITKIYGVYVQHIIDEINTLPALLGNLYVEQEEKLFYVLASRSLYGLGYKFGLTVFMENMRVHGSFIETSEFRHGPCEMLERTKPVMVFLVGADESRQMS